VHLFGYLRLVVLVFNVLASWCLDYLPQLLLSTGIMLVGELVDAGGASVGVFS